MSEEAANEREVRLIRGAVVRLRAGILAIVFSGVGGTGLAFVTLWLVVRGGPDVGRHLSLLRHYFPGYTVTWPGVAVGFFYGALVGAVVGWAVGWIYNWVADARHQ